METENKGRYSNILLFDAFESALSYLLTEDSELFEWHKAKISIAHCFASHLQRELRKVLGLSLDPSSKSSLALPQNMKVDIYPIVGTVPVDLLVHDRKESRPLAVVFYNDYLNKSQMDRLRKLQGLGCSLVLAVAFLPQKDYILIYRSNGPRIDYYHFNKQEGMSSLFMQKEMDHDSGDLQLSLGIKTRKSRKKKNHTISTDQ
ncbi:hypothetical protein SpiGrapes_2036 [Sphaerochaeta pleomorpha str. Grapes]|uniref:Uncharacterized protein n=1 Tax=Sphaerochaeta pleomorpha (strain ATCC BAA-1885 / DSM 22778 / Grapes) TaxID=158190 RepID=G8QQX5_SPHPG|nr:hypothetical protein [Sphaerochaeta pleomorpha]AEV29823.1 hypothetical protein SpiGrapes_2036 [Sphaerochaeta pleomorpha str. Grapes]